MVFRQSDTLKLYILINDVIINIIFNITHNLIFRHNFLFSTPCSHKMWNYLHTFPYIYSKEQTVLCGYVTVYPLCGKSVDHPTSFVEASKKKAKLEELGNNISERRCELKANEPVNERSEFARRYIVGFNSKEPQASYW